MLLFCQVRQRIFEECHTLRECDHLWAWKLVEEQHIIRNTEDKSNICSEVEQKNWDLVFWKLLWRFWAADQPQNYLK